MGHTRTGHAVSGNAGWPGLPAAIEDQIDELHCGTVYLTVPLRDGVIQVGSSGTLATAMIEVRKTPVSVTVRRTDGVPLQAHIIERVEDGSMVHVEVFARPAAVLRLLRMSRRDGTHTWVAAPSQPTPRNSRLVQLIRTVVTFAAAKQHQTASSRRLVASA